MMKKMYFLYIDGTIRHQFMSKCLRITNKTFNTKHDFKKVSWEEMHILRVDYVSDDVFKLLEKFGIENTIFNCSNLQQYGFCHLYIDDVKLAVSNGCNIIEVD